MVCLSTCPRCQRMVTLPEGADAAALVRCPLCQAEFPLGEAMALVPPALVVVHAGEKISAPTTAAAAPVGLVSEPIFFGGPTIAPTADAKGEVPESSQPVMRETEPSVQEPGLDDFVLDFEESLSQAEPVSGDAEDTEEIPDLAFDTGEYALAAEKPAAVKPTEEKPAAEKSGEKNHVPEKPKTPAQAKPLMKPLQLPRKRKKRSLLGMALGWIFGGLLSVGIAYYGMWWIKGESAGLPRVDWLPLLPAEGYGAPPLPPHLQKAIDEKTARQTGPNGKEQTASPAANSNEPNEAAANNQTVTEQPSTLPPPAVEGGEIPIPGLDAGEAPPDEAAKPAPVPKIGPHPPADYTFIDFDNALQEVTDAFFKTGKVSAENYPAFCRLAQVQTYIAPFKVAAAQRQGVKELLGNIAKDPEQVAAIGRLATEAVKNPGEQPGGIVLAGKAGKIVPKDGLFGTFIKLTGTEETVIIIAAKPFGFQPDDEVLILGAMVAKPGENIAGYKGSMPLVIWFSESVPVPAK